MNLINSSYFTAAPHVSKDTIGVTAAANVVFQILTDSQLKALNVNTNQTINNVLRNFTPKIIVQTLTCQASLISSLLETFT